MQGFYDLEKGCLNVRGLCGNVYRVEKLTYRHPLHLVRVGTLLT